jgi:hypothetical protein
MLRKMMIAFAAAAAITAGSMVPVSAHGGGGHGGGGGGGGHGGGGGMGHGGFGGGFGHSGFVHSGGFHDGRFAFRDHHRFRFDRFAFYGATYPYDDGCYRRVWTRWGWRWISACY